MDGNNFGNNDQYTQNNTDANGQYSGYQNSQGTGEQYGNQNSQYGGYQNSQNGGSQSTGNQYGSYQNNQGAGSQYSQNTGGQYGSYQNNQGAGNQYGSYQNGQNTAGQNGNYQNNQGAGGYYGNYQDYTQRPPYPAPIVNNNVSNKANGLQVAGLICGILAICACWCYGVVSIILGIAGLICAITGNSRNKSGVGIGALVCSIIGLVLGIASLIYYIWAFQYLNEIGYFDAIMNELYR